MTFQPPIDRTQLSTDVLVGLGPSTIGPSSYVLTSNGSIATWAPGTATTLASLTDVSLTALSPNQVLTWNGTAWTNLAGVGTGTVTSVGVSGSTGLVVGGSPITGSGTITLTLSTELQGLSSLAFTGLVKRTGPGTYSAAVAADINTLYGYTPYSSANPAGYISANQAITLSGDISGSGTTAITTTLATVLGTPGTYNSVTVNAKGLITAATSQPYITANQVITVSGDASGSGATAITLTLNAVNSNVGTFGSATLIPTFTVNAKGLITAASNVVLTRPLFTSSAQGEVSASGGGTVNFLRADGTWSTPSSSSGTVTSVAATGSTGLVVGGSPITTTGTLTFTLGTELQGLSGLSTTGFVQRTGVGTYSVANLTSSQITTALGYTPVAPVFTINTTSPLQGGSTLVTSPITLSVLPFAVTGTQAGYVVPNGVVTGTNFLRDDSTWAVPPGLGTVTSVAVSGGTTGLTTSGGPITTSGTITLSGTLVLANGGTNANLTAVNGGIVYTSATAMAISAAGTAGQYLISGGAGAPTWATISSTLVSSFNTRTGAVTLNSTDVTTALGFTPLQNNQAITLSGDATGSSPGSGNNTIPVTLATVNSGPGSFGSTSTTPVITVNAKGLVTVSSSATITPSAIGAPTTTGTGASGTSWGISITGNAATATSATTTLNVTTADVVTNATYYPTFTTGINGSNALDTSSTKLTFNPSTGTLTATTFSGAFSGSGSGLTALPATSLTGTLQAAQFPALTGDVTTTAGSLATTLAITGVTPGTYNNVTVNAKGLATSGSNVAYLTGNQAITLSGDATGSGATAIAVTLATVNGNVGSFTNANITVNAKGLITAAANGSSSGGVSSLTGTANQITASASTGAVTLSTPSTFVAPGTIQDTTGMLYSTTPGISAAGTTQGTATALTTSYNVVTTVAASSGVVLPTGVKGLICVVVNLGANTLEVYPASGAAIDAGATNVAVTLATKTAVTYQAISATQWYTTDQPLVAGTGISLSQGNGSITATNTGVTSFSAGSTGLTPSVATTGPITLGGTLAIASGGTGQVTAAAAFSALSPITTTGDIIYSSSGTTNSRLAIGASNELLTVVSGVPAWVYPTIAQNSKTASYTLALSDGGGHIYLNGSTASQTVTIPANASIAFPIGSSVTIVNDSSQNWSIAITSDTLVWTPAGTGGTRTIAQYGVCTLLKVTSTKWYISGTGLT